MAARHHRRVRFDADMDRTFECEPQSFTQFYVVPACEEGNLKLVRTLMHKYGASVIDLHNPDVLLGAVRYGNLKVVQYLRNMGVNVCIKNSEAVRLACGTDSLKLVQLLVAAGADIHAHMSECWNRASVHNRVNILKWLFQTFGAPPRPNQSVCLEWAIRASCVPQVRYVLHDLQFDIAPDRTRWLMFALSDGGDSGLPVFRMLYETDTNGGIHMESHTHLVLAALDLQYQAVFQFLVGIITVHVTNPVCAQHTWERMASMAQYRPWAMKVLLDAHDYTRDDDAAAVVERMYIAAIYVDDDLTMRRLCVHIEGMAHLAQCSDASEHAYHFFCKRPDFDIAIARTVLVECQDDKVFRSTLWPRWSAHATQDDKDVLLYVAQCANKVAAARTLLESGATTDRCLPIARFAPSNDAMTALLVEHGMCPLDC